MRYEPFHQSCIGKSHVVSGIGCQDDSMSSKMPDGATAFAAVADGHGGAPHFRSERGSRFACQCAWEAVSAMLIREQRLGRNEEQDNRRISALKEDILQRWQGRVLEDLTENPLLDEEISRITGRYPEADLSDAFYQIIAYGTTLCAVWANETGWESVQMGDGALTVIDREGHFLWPMPKSQVNQGNRTASLCMRDPMREFRHCGGQEQPAGILAYTDGIEKIFPEQGMELISLLHWIWQNQLAGNGREENLKRNLEMLTNRSFIGDDLSIAGLIDPRAVVQPPVYTRDQLEMYRKRVRDCIDTTGDTIRYNQACLNSLSPDREADAERIRAILARKQTEMDQLLKQEEAFLNMSRKGCTP